jgi:hypothetical protein
MIKEELVEESEKVAYDSPNAEQVSDEVDIEEDMDDDESFERAQEQLHTEED